MNQEEKLLKIINHYGAMPQLKYFQSEVFELNEAIINYEYDCLEYDEVERNLKKHITEELADVMVMLEQFKLYYGITSEEITNIFWSKVDRQLERIERENEK
jgi:NTP pyrophosphatase (non-canonical NTP hydrolase)